MIFYAATIIGLVSVSMILQLSVSNQLNIQKAIAMDKPSQYNECKDNSTSCMNVGSNNIPLSTNSPSVKKKGDNSRQANSSNHNSQTDTPLLLPFPWTELLWYNMLGSESGALKLLKKLSCCNIKVKLLIELDRSLDTVCLRNHNKNTIALVHLSALL